jgi:hypothetical protein
VKGFAREAYRIGELALRHAEALSDTLNGDMAALVDETCDQGRAELPLGELVAA